MSEKMKNDKEAPKGQAPTIKGTLAEFDERFPDTGGSKAAQVSWSIDRADVVYFIEQKLLEILDYLEMEESDLTFEHPVVATEFEINKGDDAYNEAVERLNRTTEEIRGNQDER